MNLDLELLKNKLDNLIWNDVNECLPARKCEVIIVTSSGTVMNVSYNPLYDAFNSTGYDDACNEIRSVAFWAYWEVDDE